VAVYLGLDNAADVLRDGEFQLLLVSFWENARQIVPLAREHSPNTRVLIYTVDLHFIRNTRRALLTDGAVDETIGAAYASEVNAYAAADGLIAVSQAEADVLENLFGREAHVVTPADSMVRSSVPFAERKGMFFVGNFRHLPNADAVRFACEEIVPRLPPDLLRQHRLRIVGSALDDATIRIASETPGVDILGWVPEIVPYLHSSRLSLLPLLYGAGVKRKVLQSLMAGTPVVTTSIGAEGLGIKHGKHAFVSDDPDDLATATAILLTDAQVWNRFADAGWRLALRRFDIRVARSAFLRAVRQTLDGDRAERRRPGIMSDWRSSDSASVRRAIESVTPPGSIVAVMATGDECPAELSLRSCFPFPQQKSTGWPEDTADFIDSVDQVAALGASHLVVTSRAQRVFQVLPDLSSSLGGRYRKVFYDPSCSMYDISSVHSAPVDVTTPKPRVLVRGTYGRHRSGPPRSLYDAIASSRSCDVSQEWTPGDYGHQPEIDGIHATNAEWTVLMDDRVIVPSGFLDDLVEWASRLDVERVQPAHDSGPAAAPPSTERLRGCIAREIPSASSIPLLAVRSPAGTEGPVAIIDALPIRLANTLDDKRSPANDHLRAVWVRDDRGTVHRVPLTRAWRPRLSVVIATYARPGLLSRCLDGFVGQTLPSQAFEIIVIDDGSPGTEVAEVVSGYSERLPLVSIRIEHGGRSAAKNLGVLAAKGDIVLFFDDDDSPAPDMLAEHLKAHRTHPGEQVAVLGYTEWAPSLARTPFLHYLTDIDHKMFAYGTILDGDWLDWRYFWEGRLSCRRSMLVRHGLHDQRLDYSIDVELARRLSASGLRVVHHRAAVSYMERGPTLEDFCARMEAKGAANAIMAWLHPDDEMASYTGAHGAEARWASLRDQVPAIRRRVVQLQREAGQTSERDGLGPLWAAYRQLIDAYYTKGLASMQRRRELGSGSGAHGSTPSPASFEGTTSGPRSTGSHELTVVVPVWSRTPALADVADRTIARLRSVAGLSTEIIVVDNGSRYTRPFDAVIHRFEENHGVAVAWNTGLRLARAKTVAFVNSDCTVERGWDEALFEAANSGRRIAFPYTDHGDELGYRQPDQAGTAGWCFMLTKDLYHEIGPFDERFSPAFGEDTDYFHRAWMLGIELTPVPAARVHHVRRTTASGAGDWELLLLAHRYMYGWKHGVDPLRAPPFYERQIVEYSTNAGPLSGGSIDHPTR
jgi:glycosyltransferase involved in cell wall biosynthesis